MKRKLPAVLCAFLLLATGVMAAVYAECTCFPYAQKNPSFAGINASSPAQSYIMLFKDNTWKGPNAAIKFQSGGTVNLDGGATLHDTCSSFVFVAPPNVELELCENHSWQSNFPGKTYRIKGSTVAYAYNQNCLDQFGLNDRVSSMRWYVNGQLANVARTTSGD